MVQTDGAMKDGRSQCSSKQQTLALTGELAAPLVGRVRPRSPDTQRTPGVINRLTSSSERDTYANILADHPGVDTAGAADLVTLNCVTDEEVCEGPCNAAS